MYFINFDDMTTITLQTKKPTKELIATLEYIALHPEIASEFESYMTQKGLKNISEKKDLVFADMQDLKTYIRNR